MCGSALTGRADAPYCSSACRQKAHRARTAGARPRRVDTIELIKRTRAARRRSRKVREEAVQCRSELVTAFQQLALSVRQLPFRP